MFFSCARPIVAALALLAATAAAADERAVISRAELDTLRSAPVGARVVVARMPLDVELAGRVRLRRIDVYAPGAKVLVANGDALREIPRSDWLHFIADPQDPASPRLALSISPDGRQSTGVLMAPSGTFELQGDGDASGIVVTARNRTDRTPDGRPLAFSCGADTATDVDPLGHSIAAGRPATDAPPSPTVASRAAVIAIDTDESLLGERFDNDTTAAANYVAQLFAQLNVVYERDLDLTLQQGTTILRPGGDPYGNADTQATVAQLVEFGTFWQNMYPGTPRVLAALLSGNSDFPLSSSGIAWRVSSGNWCTMRSGSGGAYSVSQVYTLPSLAAAADVVVVAHELGHNFGVAHTHCTNSAGQFNTGIGTLDQCWSEEASCYSGPVVCPLNATERTVMSYCHLNGCGGATALFHPVQVQTLLARIAQNFPGCIVDPATQNDPPTISAPASLSVLEDATSPLVGISFADPDAALGQVKASFSVASGTINAATSPGITIGSALGGRSLTGTLPAINQYLAQNKLTWTAPAGATGNVDFGIGITDNGNTGTGGALSANTLIQLAIQPVNDGPSLTGPGTALVTEDGATAITGITFADIDAGNAAVTATFAVPTGSVIADASASVTVAGTPTSRTITGTLAALNAAIAGGNVRYLTAPDSTAPVAMTVTIDDNGATGQGGPLTAQVGIAISVSGVNDAPRIGVPAQILTAISGPAPLTGITFADPDSGSAPITLAFGAIGTLYGTTQGGVTVTGNATTSLTLTGTSTAISAFLATTPPAYEGPGGTLTLTANDGGASGSGGTQVATASVTMFADVLLRHGFE